MKSTQNSAWDTEALKHLLAPLCNVYMEGIHVYVGATLISPHLLESSGSSTSGTHSYSSQLSTIPQVKHPPC